MHMPASFGRFATFGFALVSLAASACAAPSGPTEDDFGEPRHAADAPEAAVALSGEEGAAAPSAVFATLVGEGVAKSPVAELRVLAGGQETVYEVLAYEFGMNAASGSLGSNSGAIPTTTRTSRPLDVVVRAKAGAHPLQRAAFGGSIEKVMLVDKGSEKEAKVKSTNALATFELPVVRSLAFDSADAAVETFEIAFGIVTVSRGAAIVTVNTQMNTVSCAAPCPCGSELGPYVQTSDASLPIAKGATRIDRLAVAVSHPSTSSTGSSKSGGATAVRPQLDAFEIEGMLGESAVCALFHAGNHDPSMTASVASPLSAKLGPRESTSWEACYASVEGVGFASSAAGPRFSVSFDAAGLIRTDRSFELETGKLLDESAFGWSFATHKQISSCSAVFEGASLGL